jgi:hypothetical protein
MKHTGPAPFGFNWKEDRLYVVEKEAQIRRLAFELYAELRSKGAVAKRLNADRHKTRRGGSGAMSRSTDCWCALQRTAFTLPTRRRRETVVSASEDQKTNGGLSNVHASYRSTFGSACKPRCSPKFLEFPPPYHAHIHSQVCCSVSAADA